MNHVRRIRSGEGPGYRELRLRALRSDPGAFASSHEREAAWSPDVWDRRVEESSFGPEQCLFVAEVEGALAGMAAAYMADDPETRHLVGMWVAPEARSRGLGTDLVEAVVDWSHDAGAIEMRLWVVDTNETARRLYERAGFESTDRTQPLPSDSSITEIEMVLRLDRSGG